MISQPIASKAAGRWLLLIHHVPPKPDYFRVKVRRRLQRIGAVPVKNSVYILPNTDEAMEDLQWLQRAIVEEGGEAMLCTAGLVEGISDAEVEEMFRGQAAEEYAAVIENARAAADEPSEGDLRRLQRQLAQAHQRDYFSASNGMAARSAVRDLEETVTGSTIPTRDPEQDQEEPVPRGATWVTRQGVFADRIASAWLIRRFIDQGARFNFVPAKGYRPAPGELRFDMFDGEYTHEGDRCTFEVLLARFGLREPALETLAEIVHDIDCKDEKFGRDEAIGLEAVLRGVVSQHRDDEARLEAGAAIFDGLYSAHRSRE